MPLLVPGGDEDLLLLWRVALYEETTVFWKPNCINNMLLTECQQLETQHWVRLGDEMGECWAAAAATIAHYEMIQLPSWTMAQVTRHLTITVFMASGNSTSPLLSGHTFILISPPSHHPYIFYKLGHEVYLKCIGSVMTSHGSHWHTIWGQQNGYCLSGSPWVLTHPPTSPTSMRRGVFNGPQLWKYISVLALSSNTSPFMKNPDIMFTKLDASVLGTVSYWPRLVELVNFKGVSVNAFLRVV